MEPFDTAELLIRLDNLLALHQQLQTKYATITNPQITIQKEKTLDDIFLEKLHAILENHYEDSALDVCDDVEVNEKFCLLPEFQIQKTIQPVLL